MIRMIMVDGPGRSQVSVEGDEFDLRSGATGWTDADGTAYRTTGKREIGADGEIWYFMELVAQS